MEEASRTPSNNNEHLHTNGKLALKGVLGQHEAHLLADPKLNQKEDGPTSVVQPIPRPNSLNPVQPIFPSKNRLTLPKNQPMTLTNMMKFVTDFFYFVEKEYDPCDDSGTVVKENDASGNVVANDGINVSKGVVNCFELVSLEEPPIEQPNFDELIVKPHILVGQFICALGIVFGVFTFNGARHLQWRIAWAFSLFHCPITLVSLWIWDELRKDFSIGLYHSHKTNEGSSIR